MSDINKPRPDDRVPVQEKGKGGRSPTYEDGVELGEEEQPADDAATPPRTDRPA